MADPDRHTEGAPPSQVHVGPEHHRKGVNWLAWLALLAGILALLFALSRCNRDDRAVAPAVTNEVTAAGPVTATPPDNTGRWSQPLRMQVQPRRWPARRRWAASLQVRSRRPGRFSSRS